jgi:hypothetical protein
VWLCVLSFYFTISAPEMTIPAIPEIEASPPPPVRSKSLHSPSAPTVEQLVVSPEPTARPLPISSHALLQPPNRPNPRPISSVSVSTTSSATTDYSTIPSPLLDMFDAFPAVPISPPMPNGFKRPTVTIGSVPSIARVNVPSPSSELAGRTVLPPAQSSTA